MDQTQAILSQTISQVNTGEVSKWVEAFLTDRRVSGKSKGTIKFYRNELVKFRAFLTAQQVETVAAISPDILRAFIEALQQNGQNAGGVHAAYRSVKAFLLWYEEELEPEGWKNPIRKVKLPPVPIDPLDPVANETIQAMLKTCAAGTFLGERDKALLLALLDTGARVAEMLGLDLSDVDISTGALLLRQAKGKKPRTVFLGQKTRKVLRAYLRLRTDSHPAVWINCDGERLQYDGLRSMLTRRARKAGVAIPTPHDFRRACSLTLWRNGVDLMTISRILGHTSLSVLSRYLKQTGEDLKTTFMRASPVDNM